MGEHTAEERGQELVREVVRAIERMTAAEGRTGDLVQALIVEVRSLTDAHKASVAVGKSVANRKTNVDKLVDAIIASKVTPREVVAYTLFALQLAGLGAGWQSGLLQFATAGSAPPAHVEHLNGP